MKSSMPVNPDAIMVAAVTPLRAEVECLLDMLAVALPIGDAGGLLRREREGVAHLARIEPQHRGCGGGGAERRRQAVGAVAFGVERAEAEREDRPRADVVAERDRAKHVVAAAPGRLRGGERRRHDAAAGMEAASEMGIVGLVAVGRHAVGEGGVDRGGQDARADHGRLRLAAETVDIARGEFAGLEARPRHHGCDGIQRVQLGLGDDRGRQLAIERLRHVFGERGSDRGDRLLLDLFCGGFRLRGLARRRALVLGEGGCRSERIRQDRRAAAVDDPPSRLIRIILHGVHRLR
jgi:hypothetical protein